MALPGTADVILIRHAPSDFAGRLAGRLDVPARLPQGEALALARDRLSVLSAPARVVSSPARRCLESATALCPGADVMHESRLWEQDFGDWEGGEYAALPDLGPLAREDLAAFRPPGGESFLDLAARAGAALAEIASTGPALVFAHAGSIRAALGLALGHAPLGLAFEIAPLSATLVRALPGGQWSLGFVNLPLTG